jgi:predicted dienelactone hydrolase
MNWLLPRSFSPTRLVLLAATLVALPAGAATDPALRGPFTPGLRTEEIPVTAGATLTTDVHFPSAGGEVDPAAGRCPLVVFGHGFSSTRESYAGHGAHWASRGYVVLIPNLAGFSDHSRNADDLVALVDWALARDQDPSSFLHQHLDAAAIGMSGHSAGGLSALVATARDRRVRAVAPFDPVDNADLGVTAMPSITVPVGITHSEDHPCNANGSARALYAAGVAVKRAIKVIGASHCDPLDPASFGCALVCGAADAARQEHYRRYVTGWLEYWLRCDPGYFDWVYGSRVAADLAASVITYEALPDPGPTDPCGSGGVVPGPVERLLAWRAADDVRLAWDPVAASPPVGEYRLYRSELLPFAFGTPVAAVAATEASDPGAAPAPPALLFYQVRAVNARGEGP